jgi:hypothetical protein
MYDTDLHLLLGADEVGGDVMVAGHYHALLFLLKVSEHEGDSCCCSNYYSVWFLLSLSFMVWFLFSLFLLFICCQI